MKALLLVDIQNDFMPGGALAVKEGDKIVPIANSLLNNFNLVVATQDWHPANHGSFASNYDHKNPGDIIDLNGISQILWPDHCVQKTHGAEFHPELKKSRITKIFSKGTDPAIDSYSGFYDNGRLKSTGLADYLRERDVNEVFICGLATDYCVKFTAVDALKEGFVTWLIEDACRGVNLKSGDSESAIEEMKNAGCRIVKSSNFL